MEVRTVNGLSRSGVSGHASAAAHLASIEGGKRRRYAGYYDDFRAFAIHLNGAVTEDSFVTIRKIAFGGSGRAGTAA